MPILDESFNALTVTMASRLQWIPVDYDPYATLAEMQADYALTGRIRVSTLHSDTSIYGDPFINWCGRAWHDYCHLAMNAEFDATGEMEASIYQRMEMGFNFHHLPKSTLNWYASIINAEVNGQVVYYMEHGDFPSNGYEFTKGYLGL